MGGICPLGCCQRKKLKMSVDMTLSFLNKEYEDDHEKIVDVVNEDDKKVEDANAEEEEEDEEEDDDEQDQDEEGSEEEVSEEDVSDESRSEESRCEEEQTDSPQFGKRMFSDLYSPVDQEDPVVKKQKFEMSEILSSAV